MQRTKSQRGSGLNRSSSHRDKSKIYPESFSSFKRPKEGTAYYLVVCGAVGSQDSYVFSDLMGYCFLLQKRGVGGDFYNCSDLDKCFGEVSELNVSNIAFTQIRDTKAPLIRYTRFQHVRREYFFKQFDPDVIGKEVKVSKAVPGDLINIIIESPWSCNGVRIGKNLLTTRDAVKLCRKFVQGVQVNFITGACHSGTFTKAIKESGQKKYWVSVASSSKSTATTHVRSASNRIRNSKFSQGWCQSLSRIVLPGMRSAPLLTVGEHNDYMKEQTYRTISGSEPANTEKNQYQPHMEPHDPTQLVEEMVFRENIDVSYDPAVTASRRRIEYPSLDKNVLPVFLDSANRSKPKHPEPARVQTDLRNIIAEEKSFTNPEHYVYDYDVAVNENWWYNVETSHNYGEILKLLYWRGRIQNAVKDVFFTLVSRGLISSTGPSRPMAIGDYHQEVTDLMEILSCFHGATSENTDKAEGPYGFEFDPPLEWLAIAILRGLEAPMEQILETIEGSKFLGDLDEEEWQKYLEDKAELETPPRVFTHNPDLLVDKPNRGGPWGFWLPFQVGTKDPKVLTEAFDAGRKRFNNIERCFHDWFGLDQEKVLLEEEQVEYFQRHPYREPGYRFSGGYPSPLSSDRS